MMVTQEKLKANTRVVIKEFEHLQGNKYWLLCTDIDRLQSCGFELCFSSENIMERIADAIRWKKVIALADMMRW